MYGRVSIGIPATYPRYGQVWARRSLGCLSMRRHTVGNQKGGVGKSATALNVGAAMAELGRRTLLIDFDPQGHMTRALGIEPASEEGANLARALLGQWSGELKELIVEVNDGLYLVPTSLDMFNLASQMMGRAGREYLLSLFLDALDDTFDECVIDTQPALEVLTDNAVVAARRSSHGDQIIVPVQAEDSSLDALRLFIKQIQTLERVLGIDIDVAGLVVNHYDARRGKIATSTLAAFQQLPDLEVLAVIQDRKEIREGWRLKSPVLVHAPASEPAEWYRNLAKALISRSGS